MNDPTETTTTTTTQTPPGEATFLVFVFGTLKRGYGNNRRCLTGAAFLGEAVSMEANFVMQDVGFPTLWQVYDGDRRKPGGNPGQVAGEVFRINAKQLETCDYLEGNGQMYTRQERKFSLNKTVAGLYPAAGPAAVVTAWVYLWNLDRNGDRIDPVDGVLTWDPAARRKMPTGESNVFNDDDDPEELDDLDDPEDGEAVEPEDQDPGDVEGNYNE